MRKSSLLCLALFVSILVGVGSEGWSDEGRELRVVAPWEAKGLEPVKSGFLFSRMGCLERLTAVDRNGNVVGQLAESWRVAEDNQTWTFRLRAGVKFHDGTSLTAQAVAASLNRLRDRKGILAGTPIISIEAAGSDAVVIKTDKPFSPLPDYLCHYSAGIIAPSSVNDKDEVVSIVGTGPYRLVSHEADKVFRFEAFDGYWGDPPNIRRTSYHAVPKAETRTFMTRAGQADIAFTLAPADAEKLGASDAARVVLMTIPRTRMLKVNCNLPFFSDVRVRRAVSLAIDREGIARALLRNPGAAATQLLAPGVSAWHVLGLPPLGYDPKRASELLDQAGWRAGSDGVRTKDGRRFEVELLTYSARPMLPLIAMAVQDQLGRLGLKVNIKLGESADILERHKDGTLQMALLARNYGLIPEPIGNLAEDFGPVAGGWGAMGWQSEALTTGIIDYFEAFGEPEKVELRSQILAILQDELPVIPISWYENIVVHNPKLEGVIVDPLEIDYHLGRVKWVD